MYEVRPEAVPLSLEGRGTGRLARRWLVVLACAVTFALTFASLIGGGVGAASAATPGVTTSVTLNGEKYGELPVLTEGAVVEMKIQYSKDVAPGSTVKIVLGPNVTVGELPKGNDAISSIVVDSGKPDTVLITFKDPLPAGIDQGVLGLKFTVNMVEKSSTEKITWTVDGAEQGIDVIIKNGGDDFANVGDWTNKSAQPDKLNDFVKVVDGKVQLLATVLDKEIPYTLNVNTAAAKAGYSIADQLPAGMKYVADSFAGTQTTWDANGLNKVTSSIAFAPTVDGNGFSAFLGLPGPSQTTLTYKAVIADESARAALEADLQTRYEKVVAGGGNFNVTLKNTAIFGGDENQKKDASIQFGGNVAGPVGPNLGKALKKSSNWSQTALTPAEGGTLDPVVDVTYTLTTDLREWNKSNALTILTGNMVVWDKLPIPLTWNTGASDFIVATSDAASTVALPLTKAASFSGDAQAFKADAFRGQYFVDQATQTLFVNVGQDNTQLVNIKVKAQLASVAGLTPIENAQIPGQMDYKVDNRGEWTWNAGESRNDGYTDSKTLTNQTENEEGFNHPAYFKKEAANPSVVLEPGQAADLSYNFTVGASKGIDITKSSIVDYLDANVFDVSDLSKINAAGVYDNGLAMDASCFALKLDGAGNLVVTLSDAGVALVNQRGIDKQFVLTLALPIKVVEGKQTLRIKNKATLFGEDDKPLYWSESSAEATSYGDEAEVRKTVRDTPNAEWTQNLRAEVDDEGNLVQKNFVYNIALIPHGSFDGVSIIDVVDTLPASLKFEGFVADADVDSGVNPSMGVQDLTGNIQARFDADPESELGGRVTLFQKPGTVLNASQGAPSVNVLVSIVDFAIDEAIVNSIGTTSATITPSDGFPLTIEKVDAEDETKVIDDPNARFQILDAENNVVVDNVFVEAGALRVTGKDGMVKNVKVRTAGIYTVKEITAPDGYELTTETVTVDVAADGSSEAIKFFNSPIHTFAVGDYVWVDGDRNGVQGDSEVLEGVKVSLLGVDGEVVATTTTDANGWYMFDELLAGDYQVKFELTEAQAGMYNFTEKNAGDDSGLDSDADPATGLTAKFTLNDANTALTKDYGHAFKATQGIDPTWDAGVIVKTYAVGDFVWVDANKNGLQDDSEVLEGVKVSLLGADGEVVATTTTDANGWYMFDELLAGDYQVKFELTETQAAKYIFTKKNARDDSGLDSDVEPATGLTVKLTLDGENKALTKDYGHKFKATEGIDPTWDAGVIVKPSVSVGDFVWVDTDRDGVQGDPVKEPGIQGVVLVLTGPDGKPVTDVFGNPVGPVTTDKDGKYTFENLPVLKDGQSYTVSIDRDAVSTEEALAPYIPTIETEGNREGDSSTWTASSVGLTADGERDASLDFGFVLPKVSVGDYVWLDSNGDGRQDAGEPGIQDVVLVLTGPDGKPVTDVFGNPVGPVATDKDGKYTFENLPVLKDGQSYTVSIDKEASAKALAPYQPTLAGRGDRDGDSSTWSATSGNLLNDGDRDPSLDFGFVLIPEPVTPVDPTDPPVVPVDPTDPPVVPVDPTDPPVVPVDPAVTTPAAPEPATPAVTEPGAATAPATTPATTAPTTEPLSNTGFSGAMLMGIGLLLTLLGGGAVALTVRRRRTSTTRH